jgi:hypothetical protein
MRIGSAHLLAAVRSCATALLAVVCAAAAVAADEYSPAEQLVFLSDHLANLPREATLHYAYNKRGTLDPAAEGDVTLSVNTAAAGRHAHVEFLSGERRFELPDIDQATANPVILYFLERDVRDMQRRTGGQAAYFRKRVRMALAQSATVAPVQIQYDGRTIAGTQVSIDPFVDDPLRSRFQQLAEKHYAFIFSPDVPGQLYRMQTQARAAQAQPGDAPVLEETITLTGETP